MKKKCLECGEEFETAKWHPNQEFCRRKCRDTYKKDELNAYQNERNRKKRTIKITFKICDCCKKEFIAQRFHLEQKYCSKKCRQKLYHKEYKKIRKERYKENPEKTNLTRRKKYNSDKAHKNKILEVNRQYRATDNAKNIRNKRHKERYDNDGKYRVIYSLRGRFKNLITREQKVHSILKLIGCSKKELLKHLESQFTFGMNWDNYGSGWVIDHVRPCASFDLSDIEQQKICFHYSNLQPLWALDNLRKGARLDYCIQKG